jgi:multisubunit Na+/H+ antiporter MnhF subunit
MDFMHTLDVLLAVLVFSLVLCFIRLYLGPDVPDRTVAFDASAVHAVAIIALYAVRVGAPVLLDAAIITAVLGFLGTTMMAHYLEQSAPSPEEPPGTSPGPAERE